MSVSKQSENVLCVRASVLGILACIKRDGRCKRKAMPFG